MEIPQKLTCACAGDLTPKLAMPSIFNDVIGPVMRGPSSSHCAASVRIGLLARDLINADFNHVLIEFDPNGSLATTHDGQGSDMGLFGGLLGWTAADDRLVNSEKAIIQAGIKTDIKIKPFGDKHPNTYRITISNQHTSRHMIALSVGGGMIEVIAIENIPVSIAGDYHETLILADIEHLEAISQYLQTQDISGQLIISLGQDKGLVQLKSNQFLSDNLCNHLSDKFNVEIFKLNPVLPVSSYQDMTVPYLTCNDMLTYNQQHQLNLWELAVKYESQRGNISETQVFEKMREIVRLMKASIQQGLAGTEFHDRLLGYQSGNYINQLNNGVLFDAGILNTMVAYVTAMMECKSAMGVIVAAPTAGACATLPAACIGAMDAANIDEDTTVKGMLAAGMIGIFIATHASFAAEVGGCQAETGSAAGMAAAALASMRGGNTNQCVGAASMAIQNTLGLICDPVANRVEVPCLGKNVVAAANALTCANMTLAGFDPVIPLDEVIDAMNKVGQAMPCELRCTSKGGLSITPTSRQLEKQLKENKAT